MVSLLYALVLSSAVDAFVIVPPPVVVVKTNFKVDVERRSPIDPLAAMHKAYDRYGDDANLLPSLININGDRGLIYPRANSGNVAAKAQPGDSEYLVNVKLGNQQLNLNFDTGSSDLWVFSTQMKSNQGSHTLYNPAQSSTFKAVSGASWNISYGDGSGAAGSVGTETVTIGNAVVQNQAIELAQNVVGDNLINDVQSSGIVGLAFSALNQVKPNKVKTFFDNVNASLSQPVFTADLKAGSGTYGFGAIDSSAYSGSIAYAPVLNTGFWHFQPTSYAVNGTSIPANSVTAIADTGTSLILLTPDLAKQYYANVPGATNQDKSFPGQWIFPCKSYMPSFSFGVNGVMRTIPGNLATYAQVSQTMCFSAIQQFSGGSIIILGDTMFKSQYVVFDNGKKAVGFAPKRSNCRGSVLKMWLKKAQC